MAYKNVRRKKCNRLFALLRGYEEPVRSLHDIERAKWLRNSLNINSMAERLGVASMDFIHGLCQTEEEQIARELEELPIMDRECLADYLPVYFGLDVSGGYWVPFYNAEENDVNGWLSGGIRYKDGSTEVMPCRPCTWAHATADNKPCMPWIGEDKEGLPDALTVRAVACPVGG